MFSGKRSGLAFTPLRTASTVAPKNKHIKGIFTSWSSQTRTGPSTSGHTDESVCKADGLGGNGHPEAPPICRDDGGLTDEAIHRVDKLSQVALVVFAGHVGDVISADSSSFPLRGHEHSIKITLQSLKFDFIC